MRVCVTGGNKGIGHATVLGLLADASVGEVYFTSRDKENGEKALKEFTESAKGKKVEVLALDILSEDSVGHFVKQVKEKGLQFDVFINNAGIYLPNADQKSLDQTFRVNYTFPIELTHALAKEDLVKKGGRFIFVSSGMGNIGAFNGNPDALNFFPKYKTSEVTEEAINDFAKKYLSEVLDSSKGWGTGLYGQSKLFLTAHANVLSRTDKDHLYYAMCPGFVATDMTKGAGATRTPAEGADTVVFLATSKLEESQNGEFFKERAVFEGLVAGPK